MYIILNVNIFYKIIGVYLVLTKFRCLTQDRNSHVYQWTKLLLLTSLPVSVCIYLVIIVYLLFLRYFINWRTNLFIFTSYHYRDGISSKSEHSLEFEMC